MHTVKKLFFTFLGLLIVLGSSYIAFSFFKKSNTIQSSDTQTSVETTKNSIDLERDMLGSINPIFPKNLIPEKDIAVVIESFNTTDKNQKKQYTFKYKSNTNYIANVNYFTEKFANGFKEFTISNFFKDDVNQTTTFLLKSEKNEELIVTLTYIVNIGAMVDITYIK